MLNIREKQFDIVTPPGQNVRGVLHVEAEGGKKVRGEIYSDHIRIVTELDRFSGSRLRLHFGVDAEGLELGDMISGSILLATDEGEYRIPVNVCIADGSSKEPELKVKTLSSFAACAMDDAEGALRIFRSRRMKELLPENDSKLHALLKGLSVPPVTRQSVEEFLVGAGQKSAVKIHADFYKADFCPLMETTQELITLRRNTWGSFVLDARCDADFIELPKSRITDEDFVGMICRFPYIVRADQLTEEEKTAVIRLRCGFDEIDFTVTARSARGREYEAAEAERKKKEKFDEACVRYLMQRMELKQLSEKAVELFGPDLGAGTESAAELLDRAYFLSHAGKMQEAGGILLRLKEGGLQRESETIKLAWRYIAGEASIIEESANSLSDRGRSLFEKNPSDFMAFKMMLLTNRDIALSPRRKLRYAETAFEAGLRSPMLYAEVYPELKADDSLVSRLSPFYIKALLFAAEHEALTEGLALRAAYLTANKKTWSEDLMKILTSAYELWPLDGILEAIVRLLIRGNALSSRSFPWYEKAISRDIRIIRLYEYYIETLPPSRRGILPASVRKYFAVSDTLSENMKAMLYANIIRNRREDPDTYGKYREKMEAFAREALSDGRIGEDYAVLYQKFTGRVTDPETAGKLMNVLFTSRVFSDEPDLRNVVVIHDELEGEECYPVIRGTAYVTRCTKDAVILFEDASGRRSASAAYIEEPLMEQEPFFRDIVKMAPRTSALILAEYKRLREAGAGMDEMIGILFEIERDAHFTDEFRRSARKAILGYALQNPVEDFPGNLDRESENLYLEADRTAFIRVLLASGSYRKAYEMVHRCGFSGVSTDLMVRLASRMLIENDGKYDEELGLFIEHVFRAGKYDERMLEYLVKHFRGSMSEMLAVRSAAAEFYIDTYPLDERILNRVVFTGTRTGGESAILRSYAENGGSGKVIRSYVEFLCDDLLGTDESVSPYEASCIAGYLDGGEYVSFPMKIAYLRFLSGKSGLTVHEEVLADRILDECMKRGVRLKFFQKLPPSLLTGRQLLEKVFVEETADENDTVMLRYALTDGEDTEGAVWKTEPMERIYRGIFSREFTLFFGEVLTYSVTVIHGDTETKGPERSCASPYVDFSGNSSYQRINSIIRSVNEGNESEAAEKIADLRRAQYVAERVFKLEESD